MKILQKNNLSEVEKNTIFQLWNAEYPAKLSYANIGEFEEYLSKLNNINHYFVYDENDAVMAWANAFERENEKWFAIIIHSSYQNKRIGSQLLNHLKTIENKLSGWVINHDTDLKNDGNFYSSPLRFYLKNGFSVCEDITIQSEKICAMKIVWEK